MERRIADAKDLTSGIPEQDWMEREYVSLFCTVVPSCCSSAFHCNSKRIFETLGFTETLLDGELALRPPETDIVTSQGKHNRRKLLRAWVEISAWVADYRRIHGRRS